jgi:hypothetical protein
MQYDMQYGMQPAFEPQKYMPQQHQLMQQRKQEQPSQQEPSKSQPVTPERKSKGIVIKDPNNKEVDLTELSATPATRANTSASETSSSSHTQSNTKLRYRFIILVGEKYWIGIWGQLRQVITAIH